MAKPSEPNPDIRSINGLLGHLSFAVGFSGSRMVSLPCHVKSVDHAEITVELVNPSVVPAAESAVILEVAGPRALIQCFTSVRLGTKEGPLVLRTPARAHVVQRRRFPRVDVFLEVHLHTPDRPIEAVAAQMINLSIDGAACVLSEPLDPDTPVVVDMGNLGFHPAEVRAIVRRCKPTPGRLWVIGLQFQALLPGQELYLGKFITDYVDQQ